MLLWSTILALIFHRFFVFFSSSNLDFCAHSQCFVRIFMKSMFLENCRKIIYFGAVFGGKIDENLIKTCVRRYTFFQHRFFSVFLRFLFDFGRFWDARPLQKITTNRPRCPKSGFSRVFWTHLFLKVGLGRVWGAFWKDFGRILNGFFTEFWKDFDHPYSNHPRCRSRCF